MTPNLQLYNKAFETLQGYGFPVISRKEMQQEIPYPFFVIKMPESNRSKYTFDSYSGDTNLVIDIWSVSDGLGHHDELVKRCIDDLTPSVKTNNYDFEEDDTNITQLVDDTTNQELLHTSVTISYKTF
ncbi:TPA: hypothetical protein ACGUKN_000906 [Staphylococcus aureus]|nr:hypothetical protein [Staphylococcus aureus]